MELRQLKQVLVLAETLNFHRAAQQLHMAQPPLSASIRKLEEELGATLFERLPTGLKLTSTGEAVLNHARRSLFHADEVRRAARESASGELGVVKVGFVGSATWSPMPQLIRHFRRQYPRVDLRKEESTTLDMLARVEACSLDIAIVRTPLLAPTALDVTMLQHDRLAIAVSADSAHAHATQLSLEQLGDEPFIVHSRALVPSMHAIAMNAFNEAGIHPRIVQEAVQVQTLLSLVESGLGVALVPARAAHYAGDGVTVVPLPEMAAFRHFGLALAALADAPTPGARNFVALAKEALPAIAAMNAR